MDTGSCLIEVQIDDGTRRYFFTEKGAKAFMDNLWFGKKKKSWLTGQSRKLLSVLADPSASVEIPA